MTALKPCPFCGSEMIYEHEVVGHPLDAPADCPLAYNAFGLEEWNQRAAIASIRKDDELRDANARLIELLGMWRKLVTEGGVPRYTITPGAALNTLVTWTDTALSSVAGDG